MKYFKLSEFINSDTAKKYKIDNNPPIQVTVHITELVTNLLDPLREAWALECTKRCYGTPAIRVNSGYRCLELNKKIGGSATSSHLSGYAADLYPMNNRVKEFISFCSSFLKDKKFDQCIDEYGRWCHIGYKSLSGQQRKQIFKIR